MKMENKMIERINQEIESLKKCYEVNQKFDPVGNAKIIGMLDMLKIATGKDYMDVQRELNKLKKTTGCQKFNDTKNFKYYLFSFYILNIKLYIGAQI